MWIGDVCPCPPARNDTVTPFHLLSFVSSPRSFLFFLPTFTHDDIQKIRVPLMRHGFSTYSHVCSLVSLHYLNVLLKYFKNSTPVFILRLNVFKRGTWVYPSISQRRGPYVQIQMLGTFQESHKHAITHVIYHCVKTT